MRGRGIVLLVLFAAYYSYAQAQKGYNISGTVNDSHSKEYIEFANVILLRLPDSSIIKGVISGDEGFFSFKSVPKGRYIVKIQFVGYQTYFSDIFIVGKHNIDIGNIFIKQSAQEISEVLVVGEVPYLQSDVNGYRVNLSQDITGKGSNTLEILNNLPSVTVDFDNNIELRGNKATVMIDGEPVAFNEMLEQLPADAIESIQVVTNPGAKYDSRSGSGIVDIKLKKERKKGLNGLAGIGAGTDDYYKLSAGANIPRKRSSYSLNMAITNRNNNSNQIAFREAVDTNKKHDDYVSQSIKKQLAGNVNARAGIVLGTHTKINFGARFQFFNSDATTNRQDLYYSFIYDSLYYKFVEQERPLSGGEGNLSMKVKHSFNKEKHDLSALLFYKYSLNEKEEHEFSNKYNLKRYIFSDSSYKQKFTDNTLGILTAKIDYQVPVALNGKMELGASYIASANVQDYVFEELDEIENIFVDSKSRSNIFSYERDILGAYGVISYKKGDFIFSLGNRFVFNWSKPKTFSSDTIPRIFNFNNIPSAGISYEVNKQNNIRLSYSFRTKNVKYSRLNPHKVYTGTYNVKQGNPELLPERYHTLELSHNYRLKKLNLFSSFFYTRINNIIEQFSVTDDEGITLTTYDNLAYSASYGFESISRIPINKRLNFQFSGSYFKKKSNSTVTGNRYKNTLIMKGVVQSKLTKTTRFQASGRYTSPRLTNQGKIDEVYSCDLGIRQELLKRKLTLSLNFNDIFNSFVIKKDLTYKTDYFTHIEYKNNTQKIIVNLTYKFARYNRM